MKSKPQTYKTAWKANISLTTNAILLERIRVSHYGSERFTPSKGLNRQMRITNTYEVHLNKEDAVAAVLKSIDARLVTLESKARELAKDTRRITDMRKRFLAAQGEAEA